MDSASPIAGARDGTEPIRMAVLVDSDGVSRKAGCRPLDWRKISTFPYLSENVSECSRFLINTRSDTDYFRMKQKAYEHKAIEAGFRVFNRAEKANESHRRNGFTNGSRAILGTLLGILAPSIDVAVVHDGSTQAAYAIEYVLGENPRLQAIVVSSRPSQHTIRTSRSPGSRLKIINPRDRMSEIEYIEGQECENIKVPPVHLDLSRVKNGTAKLIDGANYVNWGRTVSDFSDSLFRSDLLINWVPGSPAPSESIMVISDRAGGSRNKDRILGAWRREGWKTKQVDSVGRRAREDGLIGAVLGALATRNSHLVLFSSDKDFIQCQRIINEEFGTKQYTVSPPCIDAGRIRGAFMGTSKEVLTNAHSSWMCAISDLPHKYYYVPEEEYPRGIGLGDLRSARSRGQKREIRSKRRETQVAYVNRLRARVDKVKVQVPANSEFGFLASAT